MIVIKIVFYFKCISRAKLFSLIITRYIKTNFNIKLAYPL